MRLIDAGQADRVVLDWETVRAMERDGLVKFYSHTVTHKKCGKLDRDELVRELVESKQVMEQELGRLCPYLCWPYGSFNDEAVEVARDAGYRALFTTVRGVADAGSDPLGIKRIVVKDGVNWFKWRMRIYTSTFLTRLYEAVKVR